MKIVHTSDWHLGHTLHEVSREEEHRAFLDWLLNLLERERADALLVAGDIYETANPSAAAQRSFYGFLAEARTRCPSLDIVVTGGNHDSAARLDAAAPVLEALDVQVVGGLRLGGRRDLDLDRLLVPLHDARGIERAWVVAVPYLRSSDLPASSDVDDWLIEGVRTVYGELLDAARERKAPDQALLAMGHCYMVGGELSQLSERAVLCGNQHALPADIFDDDVAYVALGHLHKAQAVGGLDHVRYCGSPIPLSFAEADYEHQVLIVELDAARLKSVRAELVPRAIEIYRLPKVGPLPLAEVLAELRALPAHQGEPERRRPFLEVRVQLEGPQPDLFPRIEDALEGRLPRLLKVTTEGLGQALNLAGVTTAGASLADLSVEQILRRRWQALYEQDPSGSVVAAFHELVDQAGQEQ